MDVLVVGAGVSGLTAALRLRERGHDVEIWARELPAETVSAVAAAVWYPYLAAPADRVRAWGMQSLGTFTALAADPATGVALRDAFQLYAAPSPLPHWAPDLPEFRPATADELPPGYADGFAARLPVVDMSVYLGWLVGRLQAEGVPIVRRAVETLAEPCAAAGAVVNCTGLGAREVAADPAVYGVRGQVQVVRAPGADRVLIDDDGPTYVVPRGADVVLGGTAEPPTASSAPDPATAGAIRQRCERLEPAVVGAPVLADRAGVRPCRARIRLESEAVDGTHVVHNYGHGGAGVTLSWGCAAEVAALVERRPDVPQSTRSGSGGGGVVPR